MVPDLSPQAIERRIDNDAVRFAERLYGQGSPEAQWSRRRMIERALEVVRELLDDRSAGVLELSGMYVWEVVSAIRQCASAAESELLRYALDDPPLAA